MIYVLILCAFFVVQLECQLVPYSPDTASNPIYSFPPTNLIESIGAMVVLKGEGGVSGTVFFDQDYYEGAPVRVYGVIDGLPYHENFADIHITAPKPPPRRVFDYMIRYPGKPIIRKVFQHAKTPVTEGAVILETLQHWNPAWAVDCAQAARNYALHLQRRYRTLLRRRRRRQVTLPADESSAEAESRNFYSLFGGNPTPLAWHPRHFPPPTSNTQQPNHTHHHSPHHSQHPHRDISFSLYQKLRPHSDHRQPDHRQPVHRQSDHWQPDHRQPDHRQPDHRQPDRRQPDHRQPDRRQPDHRQTDHRQPDHWQPHHRQTDHRQPDHQRQPLHPTPTNEVKAQVQTQPQSSRQTQTHSERPLVPASEWKPAWSAPTPPGTPPPRREWVAKKKIHTPEEPKQRFYKPIPFYALRPEDEEERKKEGMLREAVREEVQQILQQASAPCQVPLSHLAPQLVSGKGLVRSENPDSEIRFDDRPPPPSPPMHGMHIHEFGNVTGPGCFRTGSHFNPERKRHGGPDDANRHVGDLGNIIADQPFYFEDFKISLFGRNNILGRSLVIHSFPDDHGKGKTRKSRRTGNAGLRIACGVIGRRDLVFVHD